MDQQEKLLKFQKAVFAEIEQKTAMIRTDAEQNKTCALEQAKEALLAKAENELHEKTAEIRQKSRRETAKCSLELKRTLLKKRTELTEKIFAEVEDKLRAYRQTEEYRSALLKRVAAFSAAHPTTDPVLSVGEDDMALADSLQKAFGRPCELCADSAAALGGFIVFDRAQNLYYDETFAQKLADQKPYFIEHSGFTL